MTETAQAAGLFRKKPVTVSAVRWHRHGDDPDVVSFLAARPDARPCDQCPASLQDHGWISTLEAGHRVCPGDWLITGVRGERYPCKDGIFRETYEPAGEPVAAVGGAALGEVFWDAYLTALGSAKTLPWSSLSHSDRKVIGVAVRAVARALDGELHALVRDMLQAYPDTADVEEWRDRAGSLGVTGPDGQPYRAYTEADLAAEDTDPHYARSRRAVGLGEADDPWAESRAAGAE